MGTQHTSGPWTIGMRGINIVGPGGQVASVGPFESGGASKGNVGIVEANARLIAAAPDLLEACKFLMSFVPPWAKEVPEGLDPTMYGTNSYRGDLSVKRRVDQARSVIAKAESTSQPS